MSPEEEYENNLLAAGGIWAALHQAGLDPEIVTEDGLVTNAVTVKIGYLKSVYMVTVVRVPDSEIVDEVPDEEEMFARRAEE